MLKDREGMFNDEFPVDVTQQIDRKDCAIIKTGPSSLNLDVPQRFFPKNLFFNLRIQKLKFLAVKKATF